MQFSSNTGRKHKVASNQPSLILFFFFLSYILLRNLHLTYTLMLILRL